MRNLKARDVTKVVVVVIGTEQDINTGGVRIQQSIMRQRELSCHSNTNFTWSHL